MSKAGSPKFQEASTVRIRQHLREAARDDAVHQLMLHIYSPGGHVDGTHDLAADVSRIGQMKPVFAHIEDLGASAAYWIASQAQRITATTTSRVGSIGTVAVLEDTSKRMDRLGIEVHVISTGPYKGVGVKGTPISPEGLAYVRSQVESLNQHFLADVQRGRGMTPAQVDSISDGRMHIASMAQRYGLIDAVQSFDDALAQAKHGALSPAQVQPPSLPPGRSRLGQQSARWQQQLAWGRA
jgi:protease-4